MTNIDIKYNNENEVLNKAMELVYNKEYVSAYNAMKDKVTVPNLLSSIPLCIAYGNVCKSIVLNDLDCCDNKEIIKADCILSYAIGILLCNVRLKSEKEKRDSMLLKKPISNFAKGMLDMCVEEEKIKFRKCTCVYNDNISISSSMDDIISTMGYGNDKVADFTKKFNAKFSQYIKKCDGKYKITYDIDDELYRISNKDVHDILKSL